jgi:hypothetical protein
MTEPVACVMQLSNDKLREALEQAVRDEEEGQEEDDLHLPAWPGGDGTSHSSVIPGGRDKEASNAASNVRFLLS